MNNCPICDTIQEEIEDYKEAVERGGILYCRKCEMVF